MRMLEGPISTVTLKSTVLNPGKTRDKSRLRRLFKWSDTYENNISKLDPSLCCMGNYMYDYTTVPEISIQVDKDPVSSQYERYTVHILDISSTVVL